MALCIKHYLKGGIKKQRINVAERSLKISAPPEFISYADNNLKAGVRYNKKSVHDDFYTNNPGVYQIAMKGFRAWLALYARAYGYNMTESHSNSDNFFEYSVA